MMDWVELMQMEARSIAGGHSILLWELFSWSSRLSFLPVLLSPLRLDPFLSPGPGLLIECVITVGGWEWGGDW